MIGKRFSDPQATHQTDATIPPPTIRRLPGGCSPYWRCFRRASPSPLKSTFPRRATIPTPVRPTSHWPPPARPATSCGRIVARGLTAAVDIICAPGTYALGAPLELRPAESGTEKFPVTWKAAPGAEVLWSGGLVISKKWSKGENGVWQVDLTGVGPGEWNFRQCGGGGGRASRPRFAMPVAPPPSL